MKKLFIMMIVLFALTSLEFLGEKNAEASSSAFSQYYASLYYNNSTGGSVYINLYHVSTGQNYGFNVGSGSGQFASVPEGIYHVYMGGDGGNYTFSVGGQTGSGTGKSFHNVNLAGAVTFSAY